MRPVALTLALAALAFLGSSALQTPPARANFLCGAVGLVSGAAGKVCNVASHPGRLVGAGKKLLGGHLGGAVKTLAGDGASSASAVIGKAAFVVGLAAVGTWVLSGADSALKLTAKLLDKTTRPALRTSWFSSTYWRIAGLAAVLTLPFLFAAAAQALVRSDLALLLRAAFGYLPLSLLAVSIAAPLTMLLLAAADGMSAVVASAAGGAGARFLAELGQLSLRIGFVSPFVSFFVGLLVVAAAVLLWVEMLMREVAIYVVVLMLPLAFSAFVWPARRVWAIRAVEMLIALILSKFAIVAVLSLGGAALGQTGNGGASGMLLGLVLVTLAAFAPWALMRLLPMAELASAAAGHLRGEVRGAHALGGTFASVPSGWAEDLAAGMRRQAAEADGGAGGDGAAHSEVAKLQSTDPAGREQDDALLPANRDRDGAPLAGVAREASAETGNGRVPSGQPTPARAPERLSGLDPIYHAEDDSWEPVMLGPEAPGGRLAADASGEDPVAAPSPSPGGQAHELGDDHDSRPPQQGPQGGLL